MKYFLLVLLFCTQLAFAETVPFKGIFWNEVSQINYEGSEFQVGEHQSAGHLQKHRIFDVLNDNPYLHYTTFPVGVVDAGIYTDHADFHPFLHTNDPYFNFHGTAVAGIFALSQTANDQGTHGVVNSFVYYQDQTVNLLGSYVNMEDVKVVNHSINISFCTSYEAYKKYLDNGKNKQIGDCSWEGGDVYDEVDRLAHIQSLQVLRAYYLSKSKKMFVFSAGNYSVDASWHNGAIHYRIENGQAVFDPLDNVMVVAAVGYDNYLHYYSNFGESVDVAVISGVLAPRCVDTNGSYYYKDSDEYNYGVFDDQLSHVNVFTTCDPFMYFDLEFKGTSASAPINAGMVSLLQNMSNDFTPAEIKLALKNNTDTFATQRFLPNLIWSQREILPHPISIPDLQSSYTVLKNRLQIEVYQDISALNEVDITASNNDECINVWNAGGSPRSVVGSGKSYEAKFYGDRCLFFRGNSYIIDFDLTTKTATRQEFSGYGANKFREYMTFRNFTNNLKSAKNDFIWGRGYGLTLNDSGNDGCTVVDNCPGGNITTAQQCTNMFIALTGVEPSVMGSFVDILGENQCYFWHNEISREIIYDGNTGEIQVIFTPPPVLRTLEEIKNELQSKINHLRQIWISRGSPMVLWVVDDGYRVSYSVEYGYPQYIRNLQTNQNFFEEFAGREMRYEGVLPRGHRYYHYDSGMYLTYNYETGVITESTSP